MSTTIAARGGRAPGSRSGDRTGAGSAGQGGWLRRRIERGVFTDRGRALLAAGTTLAISGMALGFVDLTRVGLLVIALPVLTLLTYQASRPQLDIERQVRPATLTVGQSATVAMTVHNRSGRSSLTVLAEERLPADLGSRVRFLLPGVRRRSSRVLTYPVRPGRRGRHRLGPLSLRVGDPFGLTSSLLPFEGESELTVLPTVHPLHRRPDRQGGAGSGGSDTLAPGAGDIDDATLREYQPGDDLRRVHWPVTAHRGELTVRHDGRAPVRQAVLVVDADLPQVVTASDVDPAGPAGPAGQVVQAPLVGGGDVDAWSPALEWAIEALASVATHLASRGYALSLVTPARVAAGRHPESLDLDQTVMDLAVLEAADAQLLRAPDTLVAPDALGGAIGAPTHAVATESALVTATRDVAAGSGLLVVAVGGHDPQAARALLSTLPAGTTGIALLLDVEAFARSAGVAGDLGGRGGRAAGRGSREGHAGAGDTGDTDTLGDLVGFAISGGWRARAVRGPERVEAVWDDVAGGRS